MCTNDPNIPNSSDGIIWHSIFFDFVHGFSIREMSLAKAPAVRGFQAPRGEYFINLGKNMDKGSPGLPLDQGRCKCRGL
jgi:hypothetical protein